MGGFNQIDKRVVAAFKNITDDKADIVKMDNIVAFCLRCVVWPVLWVVWTWHRAWDMRGIFMLSRFSPRATHPAAGRTLQTAEPAALRQPSAHFITTRITLGGMVKIKLSIRSRWPRLTYPKSIACCKPPFGPLCTIAQSHESKEHPLHLILPWSQPGCVMHKLKRKHNV